MDTIGFICRPDHPVFWPVAERLAARGFNVRFFGPDDPMHPSEIDTLAALVNKAIQPASFAALHYADRTGVPTWNGFLATTALSCRLVALHALEAVGCDVPAVSFEPPEGEYVAKARYRWEGAPTRGEGDFYQERIRTEPVDYRYYAVDDGINTHVRAVAVRWSLSGQERLVDEVDVDVTLATRVRELLDRFDARGLSIDFAAGEDGWYALAVDPVPSLSGAGMERRIADSVASLTTIGA